MPFTTQTHIKYYRSPWAKKELAFVGKRYTPEQSSTAGATLLFFHCSGSHKEAWETAIESILANGKIPTTGESVIREAWSFDLPNHGQAAEINEQVWREGQTGLTVEECGEGLKAFLDTGILSGHRLVGIGHSLGVAALMLGTATSSSQVACKQYILLEPALITRELQEARREEREGVLNMVSYAISKRKDTWSSREEAVKYFMKRLPWQLWDPRVVNLYAQYGLRDTDDGVQLRCDKHHERRTYVCDDIYFDILERMGELDPSIPFHYIFGSKFDIVPEWIHNSVLEVRPAASIQIVPNAGHFALQENPDDVGVAISKALLGNVSSTMSKL